MIGRGIQSLREKSGISVATASRAIEVSPQTFWRMEGGHPVKIKQLYITILCEMFGAPEDATTALVALVEDLKNPVWWRSLSDIVPADLKLLLALEDDAQQVTTVHPGLIPPLVQTPEYRRMVVYAEPADRSPWDTDRWLRFLDQRYDRLLKNPDIAAILCETALDNPNGLDVLTDQIQHLITIGDRPDISIRIIPRHVGVHPVLITGAFDLVEFPEHPISPLSEPPMVHIPGYTSAVYVDDDTGVVEYRAAIEAMHQVALDEDASRQLLLDISRKHHLRRDGPA